MLCFGIHTHAAEEMHCGDIMLAVWLAAIAAVLYEFVAIPAHACRESHVGRIPYCKALRHAWVHQFWCFARVPCCCAMPLRRPWARRFERPLLIDEDGRGFLWIQWEGARAAHDRLLLAHGAAAHQIENANPLAASLLRDASASTLRAELTQRMLGGLMRDASPSDLEAMLSTVQQRRQAADARGGRQARRQRRANNY